jgi:hypothetical protein
MQENRQPRPMSKSVFGTLDTVASTQPTAVLQRRKRAHTGFSFDHPGFESHFADEVRPTCRRSCLHNHGSPERHCRLMAKLLWSMLAPVSHL